MQGMGFSDSDSGDWSVSSEDESDDDGIEWNDRADSLEHYTLSQIVKIQLIAIKLMNPQSLGLFLTGTSKYSHNHLMKRLASNDPLELDISSRQFNTLLNEIKDLLHSLYEQGAIFDYDKILAHLIIRTFQEGNLLDFNYPSILNAHELFVEDLAKTNHYDKTLQFFIADLIQNGHMNSAMAIHNFFYLVKRVWIQNEKRRQDSDYPEKYGIKENIYTVLSRSLCQGLKLLFSPKCKLICNFFKAVIKMDFFDSTFNKENYFSCFRGVGEQTFHFLSSLTPSYHQRRSLSRSLSDSALLITSKDENKAEVRKRANTRGMS